MAYDCVDAQHGTSVICLRRPRGSGDGVFLEPAGYVESDHEDVVVDETETRTGRAMQPVLTPGSTAVAALVGAKT